MSGPLVSIIIDNYNYERFLPRCIESALAQTYQNTEVVVVDDASTDGSREVIGRYGSLVPVFRVKNGGQAAALNSGFAASRGDIVIFLDSDDYLEPESAARVVASWRPATAKVQYRLALVGENGEVIDLMPSADILFDSGDVTQLLLKKGRYRTTVMSGNAFDRKVLDRILPIPESEFRISADGYLVTLAPLFGGVVSLEETLGGYRVHAQNAWATWAGVDGRRFRKALEHDTQRYRALAHKAAELGFEVPDDPGRHDWVHLESRLCSLCLEPDQHPFRSDSRAALAWNGFRASWEDLQLSLKRRSILATWFLSVGLLPRRLARLAISWRLSPAVRPPWVAKVLRLIRGSRPRRAQFVAGTRER